MVSLCLLREAAEGRTAGAFHAQLSCGVAAGNPGPGTGRSRLAGKMDSGTALSREGCEMTGGAKAMQPEEVTRLVA